MTDIPGPALTGHPVLPESVFVRAAYITSFGPAESIRYGELPVPAPGPTDVLIDVHYSTVNPVDTFVRSGLFPSPPVFPLVISRDAVGVVAAVGDRSTGFAVGDRVWCNSLGYGGRQGAAAEQAVVSAERLYHLPEGVPAADAAAVIHPGATAYLALNTHGQVRAGETVLVAGAAGNVGAALVVQAVQAGATVIATARSCDADYCRSLGASEVLDYREPSLVDQVRQLAPGGVDLFMDTSGANDLVAAVDVLAHRGRIVLLAGARSRPVLPAGTLYMKDGSIRGFVISHATSAELAEAAQQLNRLLATGRLRAREVEQTPLAEAADAHRRLEDGQMHGRRTVLRIQAE